MSIAQILILLLALSAAGNAWLGQAWLSARDGRNEASGQRDQARGVASACSDATEALMEAGDKRKKENAVDVAKAATAAASRERAAWQQLLAQPTRPGDDCGSAGDRFNNWLKARKQ